MQGKSKARIFISNLLYAFLAQGISLLLSVLMSLVVPKILGVKEFGYWQLFLFYTSFVGFFHFGLNDGIYLRYGGIPYKKLNFRLLNSQLWVSLAGQSLISIAGIIYAVVFVSDPSRKYVLIATAIFLLLNNACNYLWFVFQLSNETKIYSISVIINKVFFIFGVLILLLNKERHFQPFIIFYGISQLLAFVYCMLVGKRIILAKFLPIRRIVSEIWINIKVGINLLFSNIADMLVIGTGRFVIDLKWGISVFGIFSFAISLTTFFIQFIMQVSMVLFPTLRQINSKQLRQFFKMSRNTATILLTGVFLVYLPVKYILGLWLPNYRTSLEYMALLLPLCAYDGKMQMLFCTYLKVLRKEKALLLANLMTFIASAILSLLGGYVIHNVYFIIISMVFVIALRSILCEIYLSNIMHISYIKSIVSECILSILFVLCTWFLKPLTAFIIYFLTYSTYLFIERKKIKNIINTTKAMMQSKESVIS